MVGQQNSLPCLHTGNAQNCKFTELSTNQWNIWTQHTYNWTYDPHYSLVPVATVDPHYSLVPVATVGPSLQPCTSSYSRPSLQWGFVPVAKLNKHPRNTPSVCPVFSWRGTTCWICAAQAWPVQKTQFQESWYVQSHLACIGTVEQTETVPWILNLSLNLNC